MVHSKKPVLLFLMETKLDAVQMDGIRNKLKFDNIVTVDSVGQGGELALLWNKVLEINILDSSVNFTDITVKMSNVPSTWRYTDAYGGLQRHLRPRREIGGAAQPQWLMNGFNEAIVYCGLRDHWFKGYQFTWEKGRGTSHWIREKLDRIMVNNTWLDLFEGANAESFEAPASDHIPIAIWPSPASRSRKRRCFKFENYWLKETRCREIVHQSWSNSQGLQISSRFEICSYENWKWGIDYNRNMQPQIDNLKKRQNQFWKQRAKLYWLKGGDNNTKFFHNAVNQRRMNNEILRLREQQGNWIPQGPSLDSLAVFGMHPDKSPGFDGFNPGFFQSYWDILCDSLVDFCNEFLTSGKLPKNINITQIVLISKKLTPETMADLRPFALCSVAYKILAKALENRLKGLLNDLISENQGAFVLGRQITDNIMIAFEMQHYMKRKSQGKNGLAALNAMIRDYERIGRIHGFTMARNAPSISHLFFADDSFIFFKASVEEVTNLKQLLMDYEKASSQCINLNKSTLAFSKNTSDPVRDQLSNILGIHHSGNNGNYLGGSL
ncbi:PREDICTED: uncharacterized protein LOC109184143 [Ipomoea nil]|uniref:uncharacterized protein LOC109184143 n=1 Tax=Ipomoea nil TaxID=35883 RepID=UPI000901434F|nr:PREDICTED: uncharacterized protein LOC109184143 [Ipomoea nil]